MVQEFHVLRCFKCDVFQVHIVKKANKWECKMCGSKQSFIQNYRSGTAKDCRMHVQSLNKLRHLNELVQINENLTTENEGSRAETVIPTPLSGSHAENKWAKYLEKSDEENQDSADESNGVKYVLELPQNNRKRKCERPNIVEKNNFGSQNESEAVECDLTTKNENLSHKLTDATSSANNVSKIQKNIYKYSN